MKLADRYAHVKLQIEALEAELKKVVTEIRDTKLDELIGENFKVTVTLQTRKEIDEDLMIETFGISKADLDQVKVDGQPYPVIRYKAVFNKAAE